MGRPSVRIRMDIVADFPTRNAIQPTSVESPDAFVTELDLTRPAYVYSTYLGAKTRTSVSASSWTVSETLI